MKKQMTLLVIISFLGIGCSILSKKSATIETIYVNMLELPKAYDNLLSPYFNIQQVDRNNNSITIDKSSLEKEVGHFLSTGLLNEQINEFGFYNEQSRPRLCYWEYVVNQLPSFVNYGERYSGYSDEMDEKGQLFAFLTYRMSRKPENIEKLFNSSKSIVYSIIDKKQYQAKHLDLYVETLINVYNHLKGIEDYDHQMKRIHTAVIKEDNDPDIHITGRTSNQYPIYEPVISNRVINKFKGTNGMVLNDWGASTDILWFHSFWVRRYNEGNSETVFKILQEIQRHYN